jgi:hypothetical protein
VNRYPKHHHGKAAKLPWEPTPEQLDIYRQYISGNQSQGELAKRIGKPLSTLSALLNRIDRWLIPHMMDRIREVKANHTSRLLHIYETSMKEWEKSKKPRIQVRKRPSAGDAKKMELVDTTAENRPGEGRFLQIAMSALGDIRKMWGMDAPEKVEGETTLRVGGLPRAEAIRKRASEFLEALNSVEGQGHKEQAE